MTDVQEDDRPDRIDDPLDVSGAGGGRPTVDARDPEADVDRNDVPGAEDPRLRWLVLALVVARVGALAYLLLSHQELTDGGLAGDVHRYVEMATAQGAPYKDFQIEYPPVTYLLIKVLSGPSLARSIAFVAVSQFLCDVGIAALLQWVWGRRACAAYLILGLPLICFPFVYVRIDLFSALLAVVGVALVRKAREVAAGPVLAVAVFAKLWPLAVAPILIIERRVKGAVAFVVAGVALAVGWIVLAGPGGPQQVLSFRDATGWQVESVPGILMHLRDPARIKFESGAFRTGVMPLWARPALTLVSLAFVVVAWWLAARRHRGIGDNTAGRLVLDAEAPLACVLTLLLFAPILSPQYVVWMLPFAALLAARGDRLVGSLALAVTVLTAISYVFVPAAAEGELHGTLTVLLRNIVLVALLVVSFQTLAGVRRRRRDRAIVT